MVIIVVRVIAGGPLGESLGESLVGTADVGAGVGAGELFSGAPVVVPRMLSASSVSWHPTTTPPVTVIGRA